MRLEALLPLGKVDPGLRAPQATLDLAAVDVNQHFTATGRMRINRDASTVTFIGTTAARVPNGYIGA